MITIGRLLKESRTKKKISKDKLGDITKIKKEFINAIENELWDKLPDKPVVMGFVKNISDTLDIDYKQAVALFKRDYPPKVLRINPKADINNKFSWNPRFTFVVATLFVVIFIAGYLIFQYINFIKPPYVDILTPQENQIVTGKVLLVQGKTNPEASILVNNQPVLVDKEGKFSGEIDIYEGTQEITIQAKSRSGKETVISRKINVDLE